MPDTEKVPHQTPDLTTERLAQLAQLFPEAFSQGRVDFEKLRATLGDSVDTDRERYSFSWAGKQDAILNLQTPSSATLKPAPDESLDFDTTQNIFIEGENLEVLKLLYKSYFGRVKMIYIDPPYNTGNDFVYPDNYADPLDAYLRLTGQKNGNGDLLTSNPETNGRYHSAWLSMMYPRLFVARQLLRDDGIIFISIDDHEISNLRLLMNEIYGEENFIAQLIWEKTRKNDARFYSVGHEYIVVYAKNEGYLRSIDTYWREEKPGAKEIQQEYLRLREMYSNDNTTIEAALRKWYSKLPTGHPSKRHSRYGNVDDNGIWRDDNMSWPGGGGPTYQVIHPVTGQPCAIPEGGWRYSTPEKMQEMIEKGRVVFRDDHSQPPIRKTYLVRSLGANGDSDYDEEVDDIGIQVMGTCFYKSALPASRVLQDIFGGKIFENPKDHEILARLIQYVTGSEDLILDFFAGSGTTGHAVVAINNSDVKSNRHFVLVQLPEPTLKKKNDGTYEETPAYRAGYQTITDIGKERIRRVTARIREEAAQQLDLSGRETPEDLGFRVFKLAESNYKHWPELAPDTDPDEYARQMALFTDPLVDGFNASDVIYEVAIKEGYGLTCRIEQAQEVSGADVYRVIDDDKGQYFTVCLDNSLNIAALKPLELTRDNLFVCRSVALDDTSAANLALQCRLKTI